MLWAESILNSFPVVVEVVFVVSEVVIEGLQADITMHTITVM
jgi:hypothetical protein